MRRLQRCGCMWGSAGGGGARGGGRPMCVCVVELERREQMREKEKKGEEDKKWAEMVASGPIYRQIQRQRFEGENKRK